MRITPQEAGRLGGLKGGKSTSAAKRAAAKRNGFQKTEPGAPAPEPRKPTMTEAELHEVCNKYLPKANEKPEPVTLPWDELSQL